MSFGGVASFGAVRAGGCGEGGEAGCVAGAAGGGVAFGTGHRCCGSRRGIGR